MNTAKVKRLVRDDAMEGSTCSMRKTNHPFDTVWENLFAGDAWDMPFYSLVERIGIINSTRRLNDDQ
jgi:hypothetical protein